LRRCDIRFFEPNIGTATACNRWRGIECGRQYAEAFVRWAPKPPVYDMLSA
jgi:hypothetical protein